MRIFFLKKGTEAGVRPQMLDYVWKEAFMLSAGYGFNAAHSVSYSVIALQQANLNFFYPDIFWNTGRLLVESDSADFLELDLEDDVEEEKEENDTKTKSVNYFKMASAIGAIREGGIVIEPPNINKSNFTFKPDVEHNKIWFGLKGIARCGENLIQDIIKNRPYSSLQDFLSRVKVNKIQATMLIKSGAFDEFGDRFSMLGQYCESVADKKQRLTLQNVQRLIDLNLLPESLKEEQDIYKLTKHLKKYFKFGDLLVPDDNMWGYVRMFDFSEILTQDNEEYMRVSDWENWYKRRMEKVKSWVKDHHDELLEQVNQAAINEMLQKYANGSIPAQEMEALSYYSGGVHELQLPEYQEWLGKLQVTNFYNLPEEPYVEWEGSNGAKKFELSRIVGTAIGRDKQKGIVGFLTPEGFLKIKIHKSMFNRLDRQIKDADGTEKSWFSKGTKLMISGYRQGDEFKAKTYKNHPFGQAIYKIEEPDKLTSKRKGE